MVAVTSLGCFVVNLGRLSDIPRGEVRVFQIGGQSIAVFHQHDGGVLATQPTFSQNNTGTSALPGAIKTYPVMVNDDGNIMVGIESLLRDRARLQSFRTMSGALANL